jgi:hypothetical protein
VLHFKVDAELRYPSNSTTSEAADLVPHSLPHTPHSEKHTERIYQSSGTEDRTGRRTSSQDLAREGL